ncbi:TPA: hypothetical protein L5U90_003218 [Pseudomonas aeruginosa]|nr:hypothetical protein [Pseudomonas aeruginosa]
MKINSIRRSGFGSSDKMQQLNFSPSSQMDHAFFYERLQHLASTHAEHKPAMMELDTLQIVGRLGFVLAARRAQAAMLTIALAIIGIFAMGRFGEVSQLSMIGLALAYALAMLTLLRRFPYWSPRKPLAEALMALSAYKLNDPASFLSGIRCDLRTVNNPMLSELCLRLVLDGRRADAGSHQ